MTAAHIFGTLVTAVLLLSPNALVALPLDEVLESGDFKVFSGALKQAGLWDRVAAERSVTLFIVSDKAMRDEGSAFLLGEVLTTKYNEQRLRDLMAYHVSFGPPLLPDEIRGEVLVQTSTDACLPVYRVGTGLHVGPEAVVTDAKRVDNGIVYVIDRLLWQPWQDDRRCGGTVAEVQ